MKKKCRQEKDPGVNLVEEDGATGFRTVYHNLNTLVRFESNYDHVCSRYN